MNTPAYYKLPNLYQSCVIGPDSLYCGKWRKISKSHHDLDFDQTMPIIELDRDIFMYYNLFKFHGPKSIIF